MKPATSILAHNIVCNQPLLHASVLIECAVAGLYNLEDSVRRLALSKVGILPQAILLLRCLFVLAMSVKRLPTNKESQV